MKHLKTKIGRRSFMKSSVMAGGGLLLGFSWMASCQSQSSEAIKSLPDEWFDINAFLKIGNNGLVTIMSPNPEGGQNVKTSMPMIVAEELDVDWKDVIVEQAPLNTESFTRQFIGGSQAIRQSWQGLRIAGASARTMLRQAAAAQWNVPVSEVTTRAGVVYHEKSDQSAGYGTLASAAAQQSVPEQVALKDKVDFTLIGTSQKNVDGKKIVTGQPLFGLDYQREGMLIAMITHPPTFGMTLKSVDDTNARSMPGILDVFTIKTLDDDYVRQHFDTCTFPELVVVVGKTTWEVMNAKKVLQIEWEKFPDHQVKANSFGNDKVVHIPAGLENTQEHLTKMADLDPSMIKQIRKDGDPDAAFAQAAKVIERTYTAPFLAHNCMEPMNFFAHVTNEKAELVGPLQKPEYTEKTLSARLGMPLDKIDIKMTRLGGGYGRRSYAHWLVEAALISQKMKAPVKLVYSRDDDMTSGIYRPTYQATYRAALDEQNNLTAFHVRAGGIPESPLFPDRFPASAVKNYLAEEWSYDSNITIGSFRAPRSNFMGGVEQAFLDEVAEAAGKDPIDFRLELLQQARENEEYDADRYAGVLKLVREKAGWGKAQPKGVHRGVAAYFCHNTYVAHVLDLVLKNDQPVVQKVCTAVDCGIVVNPDGARNMAEGAIVDGIGCSMYGAMTFKDGTPEKQNFNSYRMIRHHEAPKEIDIHFVKNQIDPTGMGEPPFPPIIGALANALYKAKGKRYYRQPFSEDQDDQIFLGYQEANT